jgi:co-chaperonin GroES (HSP10)
MIIPVLHRILIRQDKLEDKDEHFSRAKKSGIFIPMEEHAREQAAVDSGEVLAIGSTAFKDFGTESPIQVGDSIVYARHAGKEVEDPETGEKLVCLNDEDVVAILKVKEPEIG